MSVLDSIAGLVVGILAGLLAFRRFRRPDVEQRSIPVAWCGNCGQPTSALCYEHKRQARRSTKDA